MIISQSETRIISNLGWVDHGALWVYDIVSNQSHLVHLDEADYLTITPGYSDLFSVVHHKREGNEFKITAHSFASPEIVLSHFVMSRGETFLDGNADVWLHLPKAYTSYYSPANDYCLFLVDSVSRKVVPQRLGWYDSRYDKDYQGITGATEVPNSNLVVISVQRSSELVLHDPVAGKMVRRIMLAGRNGNPQVMFRQSVTEMWASDYDTLLRLDTTKWKIKDRLLLQDALPDNGQSPIGNFAFSRDESLCAIARPYSGDVVALDTNTFVVTHHAPTERQPLEVALSYDGRVYARDWHSGDLLTSKLVPTNQQAATSRGIR